MVITNIMQYRLWLFALLMKNTENTPCDILLLISRVFPGTGASAFQSGSERAMYKTIARQIYVHVLSSRCDHT